MADFYWVPFLLRS